MYKESICVSVKETIKQKNRY